MDIGEHNRNLQEHQTRLIQGDVYQDLSTIHLMLTRGVLPVQVVECILGTLPEMNQRTAKMLVTGHSCQSGYNEALRVILKTDYDNAVKRRPFKYLFVTEDDVLWPGNALHQLYAAMKANPHLDGISGLCWTKQRDGYPMTLGDPNDGDENAYYPQVPLKEGVMETKSIPLGCSLLKLDIFRDPRWKTPFFREDCGLNEEPNGRVTVDVFFCHQARKLGYRFGVDCGIKVGHRDPITGQVF